MAFATFLIVGALLGAAIGGVAYGLSIRSLQSGKGDLSVSVLTFGYDQTTEDMISDLQFLNSGSVRRTVLRVDFIYYLDDWGQSQDEWRWNIRRTVPSSEPVRQSSPVYVDPNTSAAMTYRQHVSKELALSKGSVFGLSITTVGKDGKASVTMIDEMIVNPPGSGTVYSVRGLKRFPLDLKRRFLLYDKEQIKR